MGNTQQYRAQIERLIAQAERLQHGPIVEALRQLLARLDGQRQAA